MKTLRRCWGVVCSLVIVLLSNQVQAGTTLSFDQNAKLSNNRLIVTVTGSYLCDLDPFGQPEAIALIISVKQAAAKTIAFGYGSLTPACDGAYKQFSVVVEAQGDVNGNVSAPYHGGPARADAHFFMTSGNDVTLGQNISLTGGGK